MIITIVPIVMVIVGVLMNVLATNPTAKEFGKWMYVAGLLAFAFANQGKVLTL